MNGSRETRQRLAKLHADRETYQYKGGQIDDKVLTALIAPTAVGKSTVIAEALLIGHEQGMDVGEVGSLTTRPHREGDPANYTTDVSLDDMIAMIEAGEVINWSLMPTGHIYATNADSYPATYNFLPLLPDSLPMMRRAGFRAVHACYLTAPLDQWQRQLEERATSNFDGRLVEAVDSLSYARDHENELLILANQQGKMHLNQLARHVLDLARGETTTTSNPEARAWLDDMLAYAKDRVDGNA